MEQKEHLEALQDIRSMMQRSVRFLSLSGLSGVFAGIYALVAAGLAYHHIEEQASQGASANSMYLFQLAAACLVLAIITAYIFSLRKARKSGLKLWDETAFTAAISLSIPLVVGGLFCIAMIRMNIYGFVAPAMLIFYGLALVNVSQHTYPMMRQLGIMEIVLGLASSFLLGYGLIFWAIGFGLLHVVYGAYMYFKFDRE